MKQLEHQEQVHLMQWWALAHKLFGIPEQLFFAIPNGGERNVIVASKLKAEGVRAGVPDLFLAVPHGAFSGLFIELKKTKGGRVSPNQTLMLEALKTRGFATAVCHGWIEAKTTIETYLKETPCSIK